MVRRVLFFVLIISSFQLSAQYNTLRIPDTLSGNDFYLTLKDTFSQLKSGNQTITGAINNQNLVLCNIINLLVFKKIINNSNYLKILFKIQKISLFSNNRIFNKINNIKICSTMRGDS